MIKPDFLQEGPLQGISLPASFFDRDPQQVAQSLLGKVLSHRTPKGWLSAQIVETEAYYLDDKASHASLGYTEKRKALFMPAGTIYMYFARGGDSLNFSCSGAGNAVLIKAGQPFPFPVNAEETPMLSRMRLLNPLPSGKVRPFLRLCAGQTLLCKALGLKVSDWAGRTPDPSIFRILDVGYQPKTILQTTRLGIPLGRDESLPYRFLDKSCVASSTKNPLTMRKPTPCQEI